jgi:hypothetical protein
VASARKIRKIVMIIDSQIWKYELKKEIEKINYFFENADFNTDIEPEEDDENELSDYDEIGNKAFIELQKFSIYSSIIVRKLTEAHKISDELLSENFSIISHKRISEKNINRFNSFEIEKYYDLEFPKKTNISIKNLTDRIIHSYHFLPKYKWTKIKNELPEEDPENWKNEGIDGFYFSSDKSKNTELHFITLKQYINVLEKINLDNIVSGIYINGEPTLTSRNNN